MSDSRTKGRRSPSRAFRPTLDGRLEDRVLLSNSQGRAYFALSQHLLKNKTARAAKNTNAPPFLASDAPPFNRGFRKIHNVVSQTIRGGQAVNVASVDGTHYRIQLGYISNTVATAAGDGAGGTFTQTTPTPAATVIQPAEFPQPIGTIRVYPMSGGRIGIIVDGSTPNTELTINPLPHPIRKGYAHSFSYGAAAQNHLLNIGQLTVNSGQIGAIEGFHTANLSGPLTATGTTTIDRIAFNAIIPPPLPDPTHNFTVGPGPSIVTGGDLNTLDVLQGITLSNGTTQNIMIGGDLNLLNVGVGAIDPITRTSNVQASIILSNNSKFTIGRDLGLVNQPAKGTGTGTNVLTLNFVTLTNTTAVQNPPGVSTFIQGDVDIRGSGSEFSIGRNISNLMYVEGSINGFSRLLVKEATSPPGVTPTIVTALPAGSTQLTTPTNTVVALGGGTP